MNTEKLFLAAPIYGGAAPLFMESLLRLNALPLPSIYKFVADSLVCRARNTIAAAFLDSDCTDLLMVDSDIGFTPQAVSRVLQHPQELVGGLCPLKNDGPLHYVHNALPHPTQVVDGLQQVRYVGTGFMRIKRIVLETMRDHFGSEIAYFHDHTGKREWDFFRVGVYNGRYLSEDWFFCQRWFDCGGTVWADHDLNLRHAGTAVWPLALQASYKASQLNTNQGEHLYGSIRE